jgi:hypothetical protein
MSVRKISAVRRSNFKGRTRRAIPALNQQKRERKLALERELKLVENLMKDAQTRRLVELRSRLPRQPMTVWTDFDQTWDYTELGPDNLPEWEKLTEFMKLFIGFDIGMEFNSGYSFTAHILPSLVTRWSPSKTGLMANIRQNLRREMDKQGIRKLPFCLVVETRTRSGKSRTKPHLHGYCICDDALDATRFKVALEQAFNPGLRLLGRRHPVEVEPSYDHRGKEFIGRAVWVKYFTKNVDRWEAILGRRRVFISRSLVQMIRDAWAIRREE